MDKNIAVSVKNIFSCGAFKTQNPAEQGNPATVTEMLWQLLKMASQKLRRLVS